KTLSSCAEPRSCTSQQQGRTRLANSPRSLGCGSQTVRDAIHDFNERGLAALVAGSSRPKRTRAAFDESTALRP
ncbi:MAG TPA: helix-turn-helix domain-containing protein, partial [Rubrobacter sp.]